MSYSLTVDGILTECNIYEEEICFTSKSDTVKIKLEDIIGCEVVPPYFFFRQHGLYLWHIQEEGRQLTKASINISADENVCEKLKTDIQEKLHCLSKRPKSLLVLINPIGGDKTALKDYKNTVEPVFKMAGIKCDVKVSERAKHMIEVVEVYDFKQTDGIAILGGDGSFTEVVNVLARREQEKVGINIDDPAASIRPITLPIGMIPTGSGNLIATKSTGFRDVLNSTLHIIKGKVFQINMVGVYADNRLLSLSGVTATYRGLTDTLYYTDSYRWLGRMRYYIVTLWLSFFKQYLRTFTAEITFYDNKTEEQTSVEQNGNHKEVLMKGKKLEGIKTCAKDNVVIDGKFKSVAMRNRNDKDEMNDQVFTSLIFDDSMTELQFLGFLRDVHGRNKYSLPDFVKFVPTRGLKAKIKYDKTEEENDTLRHLIMVDGEMYEIQDLEFQYWLHQRIVPLYTSTLGH